MDWDEALWFTTSALWPPTNNIGLPKSNQHSFHQVIRQSVTVVPPHLWWRCACIHWTTWIESLGWYPVSTPWLQPVHKHNKVEASNKPIEPTWQPKIYCCHFQQQTNTYSLIDSFNTIRAHNIFESFNKWLVEFNNLGFHCLDGGHNGNSSMSSKEYKDDGWFSFPMVVFRIISRTQVQLNIRELTPRLLPLPNLPRNSWPGSNFHPCPAKLPWWRNSIQIVFLPWEHFQPE